jgi:hypothetical protein
MNGIPDLPHVEGQTFTNPTTKITYTYDGVKWIASSGEESDLSDFAAKVFVDEVDRTSQIRDEILDGKIEERDGLNTLAHLKLEQQIIALDDWSTHRDEKLQDQIDDLPTTEYVDNGDRTLQGEIDQIALALETLLVQREHGKWKYVGFSGDTIPRNAGEFALLVDDIESSNENVITLNTTDLDGKAHGFADVEVGDYIEVVDVDAPEAYALFVVTKAPEGTGIVNVEVTLKEAGLNIWIGETCEIRFFQVNEQDLQLDDLDARYLKKTGGNMSGTLNMGTNPIMSVQYLGMTGAKCIQEAQTTRIKFEGKVVIPRVGDNKDGFVIKGSNNTDLLSAYHNSTDLDSINYTGKTGGSTNIATCGYVDSRVGASKGALLSHTERLYKKGNGADGKTFYFHNQNGVPSSSMNDFRKFKWKLPSNSSHYLTSMVGAGSNMGYIVVTNMSGQLQYQCQVKNALKDGLYITLELDHENRYGSNMMGDDSYYVVQLYSCLREPS